MSKNQPVDSSIKQRAELVAQAMKLIIDFNGPQLKEIRRFVDTLIQMRQQQGKEDEE
jgi:hypothetical protein